MFGAVMMREATSAREAHSLRIKDALLTACGDLMAEQPVEAITINNIVQRAGVAKGSFYNHFPDKEALAAAVSTTALGKVEKAIEKSNENVTDAAYKVVRGLCNYMQFAVSDPRSATIMLRGHDWVTSSDHILNLAIKEHITEGVRSGRFEARCEDVGVIQVIGTAYFSMVRIIEQKLSVEQTIELCTSMFSLILCGFGLDEEEAVRIVSDSARDIIKG
jgi:AcrR family transcriptional regulator